MKLIRLTSASEVSKPYIYINPDKIIRVEQLDEVFDQSHIKYTAVLCDNDKEIYVRESPVEIMEIIEGED